MTVTDAYGCSATDNVMITVIPLPTVTLDPIPDVCVNDASFTLTGGNPVGGTYSGPGVSAGIFDPSVAGSGIHNITYTYTDGSGCTNTASQTVTVYALTSVTLSPFSPACENQSSFILGGGSPGGGT